jgi:hypothetical protein
MDTPKEFFRMYYYILQAHTPLRPGHGFKEILKRAGIQEVDPPSNTVILKYFQTLQGESTTPNQTTLLKTKMLPLIKVQTGGAWYDSIYQTVGRYRNTIEFAVISMTLAIGTSAALTTDEDTSFLNTALTNVLLAAFVAGGAFVGALENEERLEKKRRQRLIEELQELDEQRFRIEIQREERRIERRLREQGRHDPDIVYDELNEFMNEVNRQMLNRVRRFQVEEAVSLDQPNRFSILDIPSSGELKIKGKNNTGNPLVDPISYVDFESGNKVAVIKNNKKTFLLVDSLQAWIANPSRNGPPKHPLTNEPFTKADVEVYTLRLTETNTSGGKRKGKKTRKARKNRL